MISSHALLLSFYVSQTIFFQNALAQSCTQSLPLPTGADLDNDDSGIRPSKQPPISIGGTLAYQCPGVKSASGKSSWIVSCNELGSYVFPSDLKTWPICQCNEDLTMKCVGITYKMGYIEQVGDVGRMTLLLPQPTHLLKWTMSILTDTNIQSLSPWTSDANLTITSQTSFTLQPGQVADMNAAFASIAINYNFTGTSSQGLIPRWKFPCVASIECNYEIENNTTNNEIWIIIGIVGASFVVLVILFSICVCCCCQGGPKPDRPASSASSQISDWAQVEQNHFRQLNNRPARGAVSAPASTRRY